jgi:hypothetical protein
MGLARRGVPFRPLYGGYSGYVYYSEDADYLYIALINYEAKTEKFLLSLYNDFGFESSGFYTYKNLNTGETNTGVGDSFLVKLYGRKTAIYRISKKQT